MSFVTLHKGGAFILVRYDRIDQRAKEVGKKKNYLSARMGHSERYLNDARKQNTNIKTEELVVLAEELETTVEWLRGETDIKEKPTLSGEQISEAKKKVIDGLEDMTDEELLLLAARIKAIKDSRI